MWAKQPTSLMMNPVLVALISCVLGAPAVGTVVPEGVVSFPVVKSLANSSDIDNTLSARGDEVNLPVENHVINYLAKIGLGTPAQNFEVLLDTGSSDLWVYGSAQAAGSTKAGYFDKDKSSTFQLYKEGGFDIHYAIGDAKGDWVKDTVTLGNLKVENFQFGSVTEAQKNAHGILGVAREAQESLGSSDRYPNFPSALKNAGYIKRVSYSVYLNTPTSNDGNILFGGIDRSKYVGQLKTVPLTQNVEFSVDFKFNGHSLNGALDTGTSLFTVPSNVFDEYYYNNLHYNLRYLKDRWVTDELPKGDGISVSFSGVEIKVPIEGLFFKNPGDSVYTFGLWPSNHTSNKVLIGDTVLRYAYLVHDLEANVVGIAQANPNPGNPDIVPIVNGIPDATSD